jgi:hypothetical protein
MQVISSHFNAFEREWFAGRSHPLLMMMMMMKTRQCLWNAFITVFKLLLLICKSIYNGLKFAS